MQLSGIINVYNMSNEYLKKNDKNFIRQDLKITDLVYDSDYKIHREGTECISAFLQVFQQFGKVFGQLKTICTNGNTPDNSYDGIFTFFHNGHLGLMTVTEVYLICDKGLSAEQFNFAGRAMDYKTKSDAYKDYTIRERHTARECVKSYKGQYKCVVCGEFNENCLNFYHMGRGTKKLFINSAPYDDTHSYRYIVEKPNKTCIVCTNFYRKLHGNTLGVSIRFLRTKKINVINDKYEDNETTRR